MLKPSLLELKQVKVGYSTEHTLLNNVNLSIPSGEGWLMMGLNGTGKTTLIHTVLNHIPLLSGHITVGGIPHHNTNSHTKLAYLPEDFCPPLNWTAHDFLRCTAQFYEQPFLAEMIQTILHDELKHPISRKPQRLADGSKGMRQHIALLSIFLSHRPLWILDEPFNALDDRARTWVCHHIHTHLQAGGGLWLTSHDLTGLETLPLHSGVLEHAQWQPYASLEESRQALKTLHSDNFSVHAAPPPISQCPIT